MTNNSYLAGAGIVVAFLFLIGIMGFAASQPAQEKPATVYPQPTGYVVDDANLLDETAQASLEAELKALDEKSTIQIAVVTVNSLDGMSVEQYTIKLANDWKVGSKLDDNGVVFLIAPNERKMRIEVGSGVEGNMTDAQAGFIIDQYVTPFFKAGQMQEGIVRGTHYIIDEVSA